MHKLAWWVLITVQIHAPLASYMYSGINEVNDTYLLSNQHNCVIVFIIKNHTVLVNTVEMGMTCGRQASALSRTIGAMTHCSRSSLKHTFPVFLKAIPTPKSADMKATISSTMPREQGGHYFIFVTHRQDSSHVTLSST